MRIVNKEIFFKLRGKNGGQLMIIISVLMGGMFLVGSAVAGLLMYFSIQQSADVISSNLSLFAANSGIEDGLYCYYKTLTSTDPQYLCSSQNRVCESSSSITSFMHNRRYVSFNCVSGEPVSFTIKSVGRSGNSERILEQTFYLR